MFGGGKGRGAGGKTSDGAPGGTGNRYDKIREDARKRREAVPSTTKGGGLIDRMKGRTPPQNPA
jgi:hypothetical protein